MLERWTLFVVRKRLTVLLLWVFILAIGALSSAGLDSRLSASVYVPKSASSRANQVLSRDFDENIEGTFTVVDYFHQATTMQISKLETKIEVTSQIIPGSYIAESKAIGGILFSNINTPLSLSRASRYTEPFRAALRSSGVTGALVTGPPAVESDVTPVLNTDLHRGELIGVVISLAILIIVLGFSWQVLIPFLLALASIAATIGTIDLLARKFLIVLYIPNIVELIGLGLAVDYSLLMITRFRREIRATPLDKNSAIVRVVASAGRTVRLSAFTIALALATLLLVPIPFIRSLGMATILVPLFSFLAAFTLQPVLLSLFPTAGGGWTNREQPFNRLAQLIVKRPKVIAGCSIAALVGLALVSMGLHLTPSSLTAVPAHLESERALTAVTHSVGEGVITPNELVIDLGSVGAAQSSQTELARTELAKFLLKDPEALVVATGTKPPYIDSSQRYLRIFLVGRHGFSAPESVALVKRMRSISLQQFGFSRQATLLVGGAAAQGVDLMHVLGNSFPWILTLMLLLIFLALLHAFKSIVLPLKAILLDLISLSVAFGILVLAFGTRAISGALGIYHLGQIEAWAGIFLFVLLFGLSMDYEVFIISSIKEARDSGATNVQAIIQGVTQTGMVVSASALIFMGAVLGLTQGHFAGLQELGIGLFFGVLIDATIIRGLLLPSIMVLLGEWNWWLPRLIARTMKTTPTPLDEVRG